MVADCGDLYKVFKTCFPSAIVVWALKGRSGGGGDDDDTFGQGLDDLHVDVGGGHGPGFD